MNDTKRIIEAGMRKLVSSPARSTVSEGIDLASNRDSVSLSYQSFEIFISQYAPKWYLKFYKPAFSAHEALSKENYAGPIDPVRGKALAAELKSNSKKIDREVWGYIPEKIIAILSDSSAKQS